MKVLLIGYGNINKLISESESVKVVGIISRRIHFINEKPDIIIDFSHSTFLDETIKYATRYNVALLIGTTGYTIEDTKRILELGKTQPILLCENFSIGINLIKNILEKNIDILSQFRKNIYETHRATKTDIPSGTAIMLSDILQTNSIVSYRVENVLGKHKIVLSTDYEKIEITHEILDRRVFSKNVVLAATNLLKKKNGIYKFEGLLSD